MEENNIGWKHQILVWRYLLAAELHDMTTTQDQVDSSVSQPGLASLPVQTNEAWAHQMASE